MITGLSDKFLYCIVHSPACRIVQMRKSANTHAGTKYMLYGFYFLPLAHLDYMLRSSLYWKTCEVSVDLSGQLYS